MTPASNRPRRLTPRLGLILFGFLPASLALFLPACQSAPDPIPTPTIQPLAKEIVLYNWPDYMPQEVLDAFEKEYGTQVIVQTFDSQEAAIAEVTSGAVTFDIAVIEYDLLPPLIGQGLLAEIDYRNIPNFENISADFRDLAVDPGNRHSVPYNWGTSGLIVRGDLLEEPVTAWADLWNPRFAGRIALREQPTEIISIALLALGYPLNSEDPAQLEEALARLIELRDSVIFVPSDVQTMLDLLAGGRIAILQGWNGDALAAREEFPAIEYILPEEGTMLWMDNFVISAKSPNQFTAEVFINYILRPQVSAQIVESLYYPSANESARRWIGDEILNDPIVYPPHAFITANRFYNPLSAKGMELYEEIWRRFLEGGP